MKIWVIVATWLQFALIVCLVLDIARVFSLDDGWPGLLGDFVFGASMGYWCERVLDRRLRRLENG